MKTAFLGFIFLSVPVFSQITGNVTLEGPVPAANAYGTSRGATQVPGLNPLWRVGEHREVAYVVIHVTGEDGKRLRGGPAPAGAARLDIRDFDITPHVLAVMTGQAIDINKHDADRFAIVSEATINKNFGANLYSDKAIHIDPFKREENFRIACRLHRWMVGWICVFDDPFFATTRNDGTFEILGHLDDGRYRVAAWHESGQTAVKVVAVKDGRAHVDFVLTAAARTDEPLIIPPERGVLVEKTDVEIAAAHGVRQVLVDEGGYALGYFQPLTGVFYRWRGLSINNEAIFSHDKLDGKTVLEASLISRVILFEKVTTCVQGDDGKWTLGYFDRGTGLYFCWGRGDWVTPELIRSLKEGHLVEEVGVENVHGKPIEVEIPPFLIRTVKEWRQGTVNRNQ